MPKSQFTCSVCSKDFMQYPSQMGKGVFCSKPCYWSSLKQKEPHNKGKSVVIQKPCSNCGEPVSGPPAEVRRRKYCSRTCAADAIRSSAADVKELIASRTLESPDGCWVWQATLNGGYGRLRMDGSNVYAHRASYEAYVGPVPDGLFIDHLCRNRACVNPAHLEPVSMEENIRRGLAGYRAHSPEEKARRSASLKAHYLDPENRAKRSEVLRRAWITRRAKNVANRGNGGGSVE